MDALQKQLKQAVALDLKESRAVRASIWVRDLTTKQYAGVNELDTYAPASLLKLPLAIVYFKFFEMQPSILSDASVYATSPEMDERYNYFTASTSLKVGTSYTTQDLLSRMLATSDNGAYFTLLNHVQGDFYDKVMLDLGIKIPSSDQVIDFVTTKSYGNIFRMLYNASYLDRAGSQQVLDMMTKSNFKGIAAPLPSSVIVAHKFGERSVFDQNGNVLKRELHDCGIVYKDTHPYTICIMTEGKDFDTLNTVISDLSKDVYDNI
jgi:hypothetical protein